MSVEDADAWKWREMQEIGEQMRRASAKMKPELAIIVTMAAKRLRKSGFVEAMADTDFMRFMTLMRTAADYVDGTADAIKEAVELYFQKLFGGSQACTVTFSSKRSGVQTGLICEVAVSASVSRTRYFIKTHQHGPTAENSKSVRPPDLKELFVYKLLHAIGIGPKPHFIVPVHARENKTVYIATEELVGLQLLSQLTEETANMQSLLQLDLISRILCLRDSTTNTSNCGQVADQPAMVDFRIETQSTGYTKTDILARFIEGNGEFNYVGLMALAATKTFTAEEKKQLVRESLKRWNLPERMQGVLAEIIRFAQEELATKFNYEDDLAKFVADVKVTVDRAAEACNEK